jgi:hypothetical protein
MGSGVEVLPDGHVLACVNWMNKVTEYDAEGRAVWEVAVQQPAAAWRLPGGNALVSTHTSKVVEVDREGRTVGEFATTFTYRLRRR